MAIKDIHDQVREQLKKSVETYKKHVDLKRRNVQFKVGDLVLAHLRKERLPKRKYTKFLMKRIGPCKVVHKFGENTYEIKLPPGVAISPIFYIADLYPFKGSLDAGIGADEGTTDADAY